MKYRIGIINDFKDTTTVVDYQKYGIMQSLQAWEVGGNNHRGYQLKEDAIWIFCNFQKVAVVKSRSEAVSVLNKLIANCPQEAKKDFEEYKEILYKHVRD